MRKLEKFISKSHKSELLNDESLFKITGSTGGETTSRCGSFEKTCENNCTDSEWVHYTDGVETWRTKHVSTSFDCN